MKLLPFILLALTLWLCGCCHCPPHARLVDNPSSQANLRREMLLREQVETQKELLRKMEALEKTLN